MHHKPSKSIFVILFEEQKARAGAFSLFEITSRLSHVCNGHRPPHGQELVQLGRAAIAAFLDRIGAWPGYSYPTAPKPSHEKKRPGVRIIKADPPSPQPPAS